MNFRDAAIYSMVEFSSINPSLAAFMDHCFIVNGNGMEWTDKGLEDRHDREAAVAMLERSGASAGINMTQRVPRGLRYGLGLHDTKSDAEQRLNDPLLTSCYGYHGKDFSKIGDIPGTIPADWLDALITHMVIVINTPPKYFSPVYMAQNEARLIDRKTKQPYSAEEQARMLANGMQQYHDTVQACKDVLTLLRKQYPNHVWTNVIGTFKLDPNRPDPEGSAKYWPLDETPVEKYDLVQPFRAALNFAYNITPKSKGTKTLDEIFDMVYDTAVKLGQMSVKDKLKNTMYEFEFNPENPHPFEVLLDRYPSNTGHYFDDMLDPIIKELRNNFRLIRKNKKHDIPYMGYPNGRDLQAGCFNPSERFTAEAMTYDLDDQGRDAISVIIGAALSCISEQGRRIMIQDIFQTLEKHPLESKYDKPIKKTVGSIRRWSCVMNNEEFVEQPGDDKEIEISPDHFDSKSDERTKEENAQRTLLFKALAEFKFNAPAATVRGFRQPAEPIKLSKRCDASDFEDIVCTVYNHVGEDHTDIFGYSFQADMDGCANDTVHEFDVTGEWDENSESEMKLFHARGYGNNTMVPILLNDLCRRKLIKKGTYLLRLSY